MNNGLSKAAIRPYLVYGFIIFLASLVTGSNPRRVGDPDYMAMAINLGQWRSPAMTDQQVSSTQQRFAQLGRGFEAMDVVGANILGRDGRHYWAHFWLYSAVAVPWLWVARALGLHLNYGFAFLNAILLACAFWVVCGRLGPAPSLLLFISPVLWWIDKAQPEAFLFSLIAIAFTLLLEKPWWSMVCLGAAGAQFPPIALAVPLVFLAALWDRRSRIAETRFWVGALAAGFLATLYPLYYEIHLGVPTPLQVVAATDLHWPQYAEVSAFLWDPNIGLFPNFPILALVLSVVLCMLAFRVPRRLCAPDVCVALATAVVFLPSFAQIRNFNSGGTPGMSRYVLCLIPLSIPLLRAAEASFKSPWSRWLPLTVGISCLWCLSYFRPSLPNSYLEPTRTAMFIWQRYPSLDNPLPEIFAERLRHVERGYTKEYLESAAVATPNCSKVLVVGSRWPSDCPLGGPFAPPCGTPGVMCYANRSGPGYKFVEAPLDAMHRAYRQYSR